MFHRLVPASEKILNANQAAELLGISKRLLLRLAREGEVPGKKLGKEWRFLRSAIERSLAEPDLNNRPITDLLKDPSVPTRIRR